MSLFGALQLLSYVANGQTSSTKADIVTRELAKWIEERYPVISNGAAIIKTPEDYGAVASGPDCQTALQAALDDLDETKKLLIESGKFYAHSGVLTVTTNGGTIFGGGEIRATAENTSAVQITGDHVTIEDVTFTCPTKTTRGLDDDHHKIVLDGCVGTRLLNVIVDSSKGGGIKTRGASYFTIDNCTVMDTLADGIHMAHTSTHGVVSNCHVEDAQDDGIAVVSYEADGTPCSDIMVNNFTVKSITVSGGGIAIHGGTRIRYSNGTIDTTFAGGIIVGCGATYSEQSVSDVVVESVTVTNANTGAPDVTHGAILVLNERDTPFEVDNVTIRDIRIHDTDSGSYRQIGLVNSGTGSMTNVLLGTMDFTGNIPGTIIDASVGVDYVDHIGASITGLNVKDYGAVGNGVTDDGAAFLAAYTAAVTGAVDTYSPVNRTIHTIFVPAGTYRITGNAKLIADLAISDTSGIKFFGAGMDATMIAFEPAASNGYLASNQDDLVHLTFRDMSFYCTGANAATATFMKSNTSNAGWDIVFDRVGWNGTWQYGLDLTGTNTNSDMTWRSCVIQGTWTDFLHVGSGVGSSGDNFVNYTFDDCYIAPTAGDFIDMAYGGSINVNGGSLIHVGDGTETTSTTQCFFRLGTQSHSSGAERLLVQGARIEHRHDNSQLINCAWGNGNIKFDTCDSSVYQPLLSTPTDVVQAEFGANADGRHPQIVFDNCYLMGTHKYHYTGGSYGYSSRFAAMYRTCTIASFLRAVDFITYVNDDSNTAFAGRPAIKFTDGCRSNLVTDQKEIFDCTVGFPNIINSVVEPRIATPMQSWGGQPATGATTENINLPLNAVITRLMASKPASGSDTSTTFTYTLTDADGTTIDTISGGGSAWNAGWSYDSGLLGYRCTTDNKRKLTITSANVDGTSADTLIWIEFYA